MSKAGPTLEFWFEFASTYSYPAAHRIEAAARERRVPIAWRAFLLGPIFREQGWNDSPFNLYPAKGRYMWRDLERVCDSLGIPLRRPTQFPRPSLLAARVACRFPGEPWLPGFIRAVYHANFAADRDIGDFSVIADCLGEAGAAADDVLAEARSEASKQGLREATAEAARRGVFGAPAFLVGDELFWGNDRLEAALDWCARDSRSMPVLA
jgi:2-hydroxychromene-2-carboxylate isomerase